VEDDMESLGKKPVRYMGVPECGLVIWLVSGRLRWRLVKVLVIERCDNDTLA